MKTCCCFTTASHQKTWICSSATLVLWEHQKSSSSFWPQFSFSTTWVLSETCISCLIQMRSVCVFLLFCTKKVRNTLTVSLRFVYQLSETTETNEVQIASSFKSWVIWPLNFLSLKPHLSLPISIFFLSFFDPLNPLLHIIFPLIIMQGPRFFLGAYEHWKLRSRLPTKYT